MMIVAGFNKHCQSYGSEREGRKNCQRTKGMDNHWDMSLRLTGPSDSK